MAAKRRKKNPDENVLVLRFLRFFAAKLPWVDGAHFQEMNMRPSAVSCLAAAMSSQGLNQPMSSRGTSMAVAMRAGV
jgi:hypothetical protein